MIHSAANIVDSKSKANNSRAVKNHVSVSAHTLQVQVCVISKAMLQSDMYCAAT